MLRRPDSIPAGDTIIEDPVMEPFFIAKSQSGGYTVYERVIKGEKSTEYIKTICYPATFTHALKVVSRELVHTKKTHYTSVKEYITEWDNIQVKMTNLTDI
jgi:hypothetical protein